MNTKVPKGVQLDKRGKYNYCLENSHSFSPFPLQPSWDEDTSPLFDVGLGHVTGFG